MKLSNHAKTIQPVMFTHENKGHKHPFYVKQLIDSLIDNKECVLPTQIIRQLDHSMNESAQDSLDYLKRNQKEIQSEISQFCTNNQHVLINASIEYTYQLNNKSLPFEQFLQAFANQKASIPSFVSQLLGFHFSDRHKTQGNGSYFKRFQEYRKPYEDLAKIIKKSQQYLDNPEYRLTRAEKDEFRKFIFNPNNKLLHNLHIEHFKTVESLYCNPRTNEPYENLSFYVGAGNTTDKSFSMLSLLQGTHSVGCPDINQFNNRLTNTFEHLQNQSTKDIDLSPYYLTYKMHPSLEHIQKAHTGSDCDVFIPPTIATDDALSTNPYQNEYIKKILQANQLIKPNYQSFLITLNPSQLQSLTNIEFGTPARLLYTVDKASSTVVKVGHFMMGTSFSTPKVVAAEANALADNIV